MKKIYLAPLLIFMLIAISWLINFLIISKPVAECLSKDDRNKGLPISAHFQYFLNPQTLVVNLGDINNFSPADIFRGFLESAETLKDMDFKKVELSSDKGEIFYIKGNYFKKLGQEYETENVIYTMGHFAENLYAPDGAYAYAGPDGGNFFSQVISQTTNFNDAIKRWAGVEVR